MSTVTLKRQMKAYADAHKLEIPRGFSTRLPGWGKPAQALAWRVSGDYGTATTDRTALWQHFNPPTFGEEIVKAAEAKLGVHEKGSTNTGRWVNHFLKDVLLAPGFAWCAGFAAHCAIEGATAFHKELTPAILHDLIMGNAAWVPNWLTAARTGRTKHGWRIVVVAAKDAQAGDFCIFWGGKHIGMLRTAKKWLRFWWQTVEGNTSSDVAGDQANGGEVCNKHRSAGDVTAFVRIIPPA